MVPLFNNLFFLVDGEELSKEVKAHGFPIEHKHKLCCLRQELIDSFVDARYMMFIKYAAYHLQQLNLKKTGDIINQNKAIEEKPTEDQTKDNKEAEKEIIKDEEKEKDEREDKKSQMEDDEAKKIVESITDGTKLECKLEIIFRNLLIY